MPEIADLWASLGARIRGGEWSAADARVAKTASALDRLSGAHAGALADKAGRWRAASGRFLTLRERAMAASAGVAGVGAAADTAGKKTESSLGGIGKLAAGVAAAFAGQAAYSKLIKFNSGVEDSRNQIAGMLSLAKKTDLADQIGTADTLMANLQKRAATLPGTTQDYISMLGNLAQPISDAGLDMQNLEDMTVGAAVAAKALSIPAEVAARDIDQAIRGQFHSVDQFTGKLLGAAGFKGEEGRAKFNAMTQKERAEKLKEVMTSKQITQLAEAQGTTFSGLMSTLEDSVQQFAGRVGKPLFEGLAAALARVNQWLSANDETVREVADAVGGALATAFGAVSVAVDFFADHMELTKSILIAVGAVLGWFAVTAAAAWVAAFWPVAAAVAAIAAVVYAVRNLGKIWDWLKSGAGAVWEAFKAFGDRVVRFFTDDVPEAIKSAFTAAFDFIRNLPVVKQIIDAIQWTRSKFATTPEGKALGERGMQTAVSTSLGLAPVPSILKPAAAQGGVSVGTVDVGGITVTSQASDPKAMAAEVRAAFDARLGEHLRMTRDAQ